MSARVRAGIAGTGAYVPAKVMTNEDFARLVDTSDEWITQRTGIKERRYAAPDEHCSDLCVRAAERALEDAGIAAKDLDLIVVGTLTADYVLPAVSCLVRTSARQAHGRRRRVHRLPDGALHRRGFRRRETHAERARHRSRDALALRRHAGPEHVHPLRRRRGRGGRDAVRGVRAGRDPGNHARRGRLGLRADPHAHGRRQDAAPPSRLRSARELHRSARPRGLPLRRDQDDRAHREGDGGNRSLEGRPPRPAPGESAHHRFGAGAPRLGRESLRHQHREVRQYLRRLGPDRAGRGSPRGDVSCAASTSVLVAFGAGLTWGATLLRW